MSLQADYTSIKREIGRFADSGRVEADWDDTQQLDLEDVLVRGQRRFYMEAVNANSGERHFWSFLEEDFAIDLQQGQYLYPLPPRFSRVKDDFVFDNGSERFPLSHVRDDKRLRALIASEGKTGQPRSYSVRNRQSAPGDRSLKEVILYPIPNEAVTITARVEIEPEPISEDNPYPRGGATHSETITEACLAAAEELMFPEAGPGLHSGKYLECLQRSIDEDLKLGLDATDDVWPEESLDESYASLEINKFDLMRVIGKERGFGPHPRTWRAHERAEVLELLSECLRQFYNPMVLPGTANAHLWSFTSPTFVLPLEAGKYAYDLPKDFSAIAGPIRYKPGTGIALPEIKVVRPDQVESLLEYSDDAFYGPTKAAARVKANLDGQATRYELIMAPPPSGGEVIHIPFTINPYRLADDESLPMGGQPHAQTLIQSAKAVAEIANKNGSREEQDRFILRLQASISHDQQATCPQTMGINRDRSDDCLSDVIYGEFHYGDDHVTTYDLS